MDAPSLTDRILRVALRSAHRLLKFGWFLRRPRTFGAHALAFTPEGRIILVRLRYAPGWRLPGGGRSEREDPKHAVLRELREEIGMTVTAMSGSPASSRKRRISSATSPRC